ncbi:MAG: EamA family transporter RarD [Thermoanaerobaculia bacterium]
MVSEPRRLDPAGIGYALAAYGFWGLVPIYFKAVGHVPSLEVLAHRVIWSVVLLAIWTQLRGTWDATLVALRDRGVLLILVGTTVLVTANWFIFIWAVSHGFILQSSLGYYINPLVNILFGFLFLKERLRPIEWVSVALAATGVAYQTLSLGEFPWISLLLAFSFGSYGLLRKIARVESVAGLTIETALTFPIALAFLLVANAREKLVFAHHALSTDALLALAGVVTALPLVWFAHAVRRLPLSVIGFFQYIAPTLQFLLAVAVYGETFTRNHAITFACIWSALAIFTIAAVRRKQNRLSS